MYSPTRLLCALLGIFILVVVSEHGIHTYVSRSQLLSVTSEENEPIGRLPTKTSPSSGGNVTERTTTKPPAGPQKPPRSTCMLKEPMLPSFIYMGYGHSGSTTTADVLNDHPNVSFGKMKEHNYLCFQRNKDWHGERWRVTIKGYINQFLVPCGTTVSFDMTPQYFAMLLNRSHPWFDHVGRSTCRQTPNQEEALKNYMKAMRPDLKFLFIVRNPVDYLKSIYEMQRVLNPKYWDDMQRFGCYAEVLEAWRGAYPKHEIKVFSAEDLFGDPVSYFADVFQWLGVDNLPQSYYDQRYQASGRRRSSNQAKNLSQVYTRFLGTPLMIDCKKRLEKFTGRKFQWKGAPH